MNDGSNSLLQCMDAIETTDLCMVFMVTQNPPMRSSTHSNQKSPSIMFFSTF